MPCPILMCYDCEHYRNRPYKRHSPKKRTIEIIGTCKFFPQGITDEDTRYCNGIEDTVERKKRTQAMFPEGKSVIVED